MGRMPDRPSRAQASLLLSAWQSGTINRWWGSGPAADDPDGDSRHQPASSPIPRGMGVTKGPSGEERAAGGHALTTSDLRFARERPEVRIIDKGRVRRAAD
jgi:hypothetical protein